jgi:DNA processing protein
MDMAYKFAKAGIVTISGMAAGVDSLAHRGSIKGEGGTIAVLGCGLDVIYPKSNKGIYKDIVEKGGLLISEQPLGMPPLKRHFPLRNRIISGLSNTVIVVEAKEKSGSLITADYAIEQGRDVYAVPGNINSIISKGCNRLIHQGAGIFLSPEGFLCDKGYIEMEELYTNDLQKNKKNLALMNNKVYSCLDLYPKTLDEIIRETKELPQVVLEEIISLQLQGAIKEVGKNRYVQSSF